jgi:hypothetical protein
VTTIDPSEFASVTQPDLPRSSRAPRAETAGRGDVRPRSRKDPQRDLRRFPAQFRADRAGNTNAVIHWVIGGRVGWGEDAFEVVIADGACTVSADSVR